MCNRNCAYCFYLEKQALFESGEQYRMPDNVLSTFVTDYITSQPTPVVERLADSSNRQMGLRLAGPAALNKEEAQTEVTPWSVIPEDYGDFLIAVYQEWVSHDVGTVFVMNFEWALNAWIGHPSSVCIHANRCGRSVVIEHNGDVYACDHCVYPQYRLGNVETDNLMEMVEKSLQSGFGVIKERALPLMASRGFIISAQDTRSSFSISENTDMS